MGDFYELFYDGCQARGRTAGYYAHHAWKIRRGTHSDVRRTLPRCRELSGATGEVRVSVAIAEQIGDPATSKGPVDRQVVRIVTPGTLSDEALLDDKVDNLLLAVCQQQQHYGIAYLDLSTGRFRVLEITGEEALTGELQRLDPAETLYHESIYHPVITARRGARSQPAWEFDAQSARRALNTQFQTHDLQGFGCDNLDLAIGAAGCLLQYVKDTQRGNLPHIRALQQENRADSVILDAATRRNLEIDVNMSGGNSNTLLSVTGPQCNSHGQPHAQALAAPTTHQCRGTEDTARSASHPVRKRHL